MNILGSGITGLLLGYLTDSPVYGELVGGQLAGLAKGPRILHLDEATASLMLQLGIKDPPEYFNIGYVNSEDEPIRTSLLEAERKSYYLKTRGSNNPSDSSISGGKTQILGWDLNKIHLVDHLLDKVEVVPAVVESISFDTNKVVVHNKSSKCKESLVLSDCINTISIRRLLGLITNSIHEVFYTYKTKDGSIWKSSTGIDRLDLTCFDTTFIRVDLTMDDIPPFDSDLSYIYFTEASNPINRVTRINKGTYVFECRGDKFEEAVVYIESKGWEIGLVETIRFCQLVQNHRLETLGLDRPECIDNQLRLCGRFAKWDHSFKINSVFEEAKKYV